MNNEQQMAYARIDIGMDDGLNVTHLVFSSKELDDTENLLKSDKGALKSTSNFNVKVSHVSHFVTYIEERQ